ncbi:restriction endonuclease [Streptomyces sp. RY43-2]|uniref:Restriction endonuclease n=1 Tax=Streptomyces macrolidinus TaxID=2952607 RepID=A0ABT0ZFH6_9ACTN|nr:restriction endonuclease [Streptomyces macrolidinus]MCN9242312.1 restriction endonuclease [Streptomyces macrolidinus]
MSPRRRRRRRKSDENLLVGLGVLVVGGLLLVKVGQWVWAHWWVLLVLGLLALLVLAAWIHQKVDRIRSARLRVDGLTYSLGELDAMHHSAFEFAVRDLLARDGSRDALRCGGRGDLGADVKGHDPLGRYWVIQCKHRKKGLDGSAVGTPDLQTLNGTGRPVHGGDVVVMVTNGRISQPAREFARQQRLHLVDRRVLEQWARGQRPLWEILPAVPPPRRPPRLR